jgi:NADH:ubiquinone oxidoreductase subunit 5 (subunit L)/multisubunit Na+/H+ antiporter MnhA subunit
LIIELALVSYQYTHVFAAILSLLAAIFTAYYSFKALYLVFYAVPKTSVTFFKFVHEPSLWMLVPLFLLSLFSLFFGEHFQDAFLSSDFWQNTISDENMYSFYYLGEFLSPFYKNLALFATLFGLLISFVFFSLYAFFGSF